MNPKDTQSTKWLITINNPQASGWEKASLLETIHLLHPTYFCLAEEVAATGTPHIHIYFERASALRFSTLKKRFPTAHLDPAVGSAWQNREYITKTGKWAETEKAETSVEGSFYEWGEIPVKAKKSGDKMREIIRLIREEKKTPMDIIEKYPSMAMRVKNLIEIQELCHEVEGKKNRELKVYYIFGETGTGKSKSVFDRHPAKDICRITDYPKNNGVRFDAYHGEPVLVFEEFASQIPIQQMLNYLDIYPVKLPARYTDRSALYTTVYIISNLSLEEQYKDVQVYQPEVWKAFLRRIHRVYQYNSDGTVTEVEV